MEGSLEQLHNSQPRSEWEKDNFINIINNENSNFGDSLNVVHFVNIERNKLGYESERTLTGKHFILGEHWGKQMPAYSILTLRVQFL